MGNRAGRRVEIGGVRMDLGLSKLGHFHKSLFQNGLLILSKGILTPRLRGGDGVVRRGTFTVCHPREGGDRSRTWTPACAGVIGGVGGGVDPFLRRGVKVGWAPG